MRKMLALLLVLCITLPGCTFAEQAETTTVVCSFYPIYIFAENLLAGVQDVKLESLTSPDTGCLHDVQLLTGDMRTLSGADVLLINGAGMEGYLDTVFDQFPTLPVVDASAGIELLIDEDEGHPNAHIWLNVDNAAAMVANLAAGLIAALPGDEDVITANLASYTQMLLELKDTMTQQLAAVAGKRIITFHEAFPYFAEEFGLTILATVVNEEDSTYQSLSPAELAQLVKLIQANNLPPLFTEPQYSSLAAQTLSQETGAPIFALDPIVTGAYGADEYQQKMLENTQTLLEAFGLN